MSHLDVSTLEGMGIRLSGRRIRIPMYMRERYETINFRGVSITHRIDQDFSTQELASLILQIKDIKKFQRFLALPLLIRGLDKPVGPASKTFFRVDFRDVDLDPILDFPASLRNELSLAHSEAFFLKPHGLHLSVIEDRPVLDFFDANRYNQAKALYPNNECPLMDLDSCHVGTNRSWTRVYRDAGLIQ